MCICGQNCAEVRGPTIPPDLDDFELGVQEAARGLSTAVGEDIPAAYERLACALIRVRVFAHDPEGVLALERCFTRTPSWGRGR